MLYVDIQNEVISLRFSSAQSASIKLWINAKYTEVWNLEEWAFRFGRSTTLTTTAGTNTLGGVPTDLGPVIALFDQNGERLVWVAPKAFFTLYANQTGRGQPIHFTVINGVVYLGPIPDSNQTTYLLIYEKKLTLLSADADVPALPAEHHYALLVGGAIALGQALSNDFTFQFTEGIYQGALQAMRRNYLVDQRGENLQWGRDQVDSIVLGAGMWGDVY